MEITYRNSSLVGNVAAMKIIVEATPHAPAGAFHVSLQPVDRSGRQTIRDGRYVADQAAADARVAELVAMAEKNPALVRV